MVQFHSLESFARMGGFSAFVWPAFAVVFGLLFSHILLIRTHYRRIVRRLKKDHKSVA